MAFSRLIWWQGQASLLRFQLWTTDLVRTLFRLPYRLFGAKGRTHTYISSIVTITSSLEARLPQHYLVSMAGISPTFLKVSRRILAQTFIWSQRQDSHLYSQCGYDLLRIALSNPAVYLVAEIGLTPIFSIQLRVGVMNRHPITLLFIWSTRMETNHYLVHCRTRSLFKLRVVGELCKTFSCTLSD